MNSIQSYFSTSYLLAPVSGTKLELFYLIVPLLMIVIALGYRVFIMIKGKRPAAYRSFDKLWFWGALLFGLFGLFLYFARTQGLPTFSTRTISYLWFLATLGYSTYVIFYYRMTVPDQMHEYYKTKRKSKYLK
jgi:drug/metabolite transporter (DMT)-like permease